MDLLVPVSGLEHFYGSFCLNKTFIQVALEVTISGLPAGGKGSNR